MIQEFKEFAVKGSMVDMAVGIIVGAAFGAIVNSFVADVIMPPIGLLISGIDFSDFFIILKEGTSAGPYVTLEDAQNAGAVTINYGVFITALISFLIVAFAVFILVKSINRLRRQKEVPPDSTTKECPQCLSTVPIKAIRCAFCTSEFPA
jgi:large conductance mechanosensitive channel